MALPWTIALSVLALVYILLQTLLKNKTKIKRVLPPGPRPLPILGHFHLLGKYPHRDLHRLAQKHGPIMYLRLGLVPNVVVSSPEAAEQFLRAHDVVFASRPLHESLKYIFYGQRNLTLAPYGSYWHDMRKLCTMELLSNHKIASFQSMRAEELSLLVETLERAAGDRVVVDISARVSSMSAHMSCRMVYGKKYMDKEFDERGFKAVIQDAMHLAAVPNIGDYFPYIGALDLQGLTKKIKAVCKVFDGFSEKIIDEHVQSKDDPKKTKDFVHVLLELMESKDAKFRIDRRHVKAMILDMLVASMDTSAAAIEWVLSELLQHPRAMKKVQTELEQVVGTDRMVEESDLEKLDYLAMVVKETFRLRPVVPLLLPHLATEDCTINGYHIPRNAQVTINMWAIGRDPNVWADAEKFVPERFSASNVDLRGHDFKLIPFGAGRRRCPGLQLGLLMVRLVVAQLVHCFNWELPDGMLPSELDMTEEFGFVTARAKHLLAVPTCRLNK